MRRNSTLVVDTSTSNDLVYELEVSPRSSVYSDIKQFPESSHVSIEKPSIEQPQSPPLSPSIRLLFSLISRRHLLFLVLPAIVSSLIAGGIAPFMTFVIGQAFDAFAKFPLTPNPPQEAKDKLLRSVGLAALELVGLAVGSLALSSVTSCLWIWAGERNVMALRKRVYAAVTQKDMVWFDTKMGAEGAIQSAEADQGPLGAGGLMAKFTRETDDVRMATSLASGMLIQYLTTCITCLILAFMRSWALTLVILSAVPVLVLIQGLSQGFAGPLLAHERSQTATAATLVDRAISAIATVKAFNAHAHEQNSVNTVLDRLSLAARRLNTVWGITSSLAQFVMMGMFVQGFWFGAKLVKEGKISAGDVMAVFWACLIATSNLQMCIPQFITITKGKFAIVALLTLVDNHTEAPLTPFAPGSPSAQSVMSRKSRVSKHRSTQLRKIVPRKCAGELALHGVTFAYPSRPTLPILQDVSLYLPAKETTFIVGASGSGKSTVAQLLLRMYAPQSGMVQLDDQDVRYLDETWMRSHVAGVQQGVVIFEGSVFDNVAVGLAGTGKDATREEVMDACRAALMHEFVRDLPEGYETMLGNGGAGLSGGQKQRLAIARAKLRNPTVLILDEATSALDATSRILVFEAIKRWRQNKTTIVITHDLSQISPGDFVYVLKSGRVVEQGYRYDLETSMGEFHEMMLTQRATGGYLPEKVIDDEEYTQVDVEKVQALLEDEEEDQVEVEVPFNLKHQSLARPTLRPLTLGNWMFDVVADLTKNETGAPAAAMVAAREPHRISRFVPADAFSAELTEARPRRPSSIHVPALPSPTAAHTLVSRRFSLQFTPTSPTFSSYDYNARSMSMLMTEDEEDSQFEQEKSAIQRSGASATTRRALAKAPRARWDDAKIAPLTTIKVDSKYPAPAEAKGEATETRPQFWALIREIYPTIPYKPLLFFGLAVCLLSGAMTPIFSFLLSRLLFEVSIGAQNTSLINKYGGIVLAVAAFDGILMGLKYFLMETSGMTWVTRIRKRCFALLLAQDKKWFDKMENSPVRLVQVLIKDGDDARNLIAVVFGQCVVVVAMLGVGLIWAMVRGWQLTLVGFAIAPVFALTMAVQTSLVAKCEVRNKRAREEVAKGYYDAISNIRGIRAMAFETVFQKQFDQAADKALTTGVRGAFVEGCTYGVASGLIYLAEALLFYVGAVLIARGTYTYLQMVEVLNLVVFTVTIGSQLMAFTQKIAKSVQATSDFNKLLKLSTTTDESRGVLRPELMGSVAFNNVSFSYPERSDAPVLKDVTMEVADGECVAIVGASGSGKSTIAALLQRLYEPDSGSITIGLNELRSTDVLHLRHHVSVVSQNPNLFDATIAENIRYGNAAVSEVDIRKAAKAAHVHEFIMSLPQGYDTLVGENASLISGGQAQRLQIARALARPSKILILDECTSALDPANQAAVMETIREAKVGRTTVMVTHKLPVMQMCDRILVVHEGIIAEQGTYDQLMERKGVFAKLASGGEWVGE
ncbi:P-loop containing nucleoside triphosphate hydrolase protein [Collybia nuda]|uniref:P-loop containing nucleoside triphosphate hydrolase protein n=1 Tax=Collybia nuda TaxID=64659 RepID=A0A9P5Y2F8_9AGAR|nr:P-loop containing nucleoside triphosphate hydrolase protein [Collybia nuda]